MDSGHRGRALKALMLASSDPWEDSPSKSTVAEAAVTEIIPSTLVKDRKPARGLVRLSKA